MEVPLGLRWNGLNRRQAPFLLDETQSPNTVDADNYTHLQPRNGRNRIADFGLNIMGVVACNLPWGKFNIVATKDGTFQPQVLTSPSIMPVVHNENYSYLASPPGTTLIPPVYTGVAASLNSSVVLPISSPINLADYNELIVGDCSTGGSASGPLPYATRVDFNVYGQINGIFQLLYSDHNQYTLTTYGDFLGLSYYPGLITSPGPVVNTKTYYPVTMSGILDAIKFELLVDVEDISIYDTANIDDMQLLPVLIPNSATLWLLKGTPLVYSL